MRNQVLIGDCLTRLKEIPDNSVHCCVTSPPYFNLRDYQTATWEGGNPDCKHRIGNQVSDSKAPGAISSGVRPGVDASKCLDCGADRIDSQIGLEKSPEEYVEKMVEVFREVRRVLHPTGTLWLNLGDSYFSSSSTGNHHVLKPKDLIGIPWKVAFALQEDGWYLRQDLIWFKGNPMPESVQDRCTKAHEYVFLLTKSPQYFYDIYAMREPSLHIWNSAKGFKPETQAIRQSVGTAQAGGTGPRPDAENSYRNRRSVWHINTKPYKGAHFAVMPSELAEICIKAGTSEKGACAECGAPWKRIVVTVQGEPDLTQRSTSHYNTKERYGTGGGNTGFDGLAKKMREGMHHKETAGWEPSCKCESAEPIPCLVLDPFAGSGTTLATAKWLGRDYVGTELNPDYLPLIEERLNPAIDHQNQRNIFDAFMD